MIPQHILLISSKPVKIGNLVEPDKRQPAGYASRHYSSAIVEYCYAVHGKRGSHLKVEYLTLP